MKKYLLLLTLLTIVTACGGDTDKKALLDKLRSERDNLNEQIRALEKELLVDGVNTANIKEVAITTIEPSEFCHYIEIQGKVDGDENIALSPKMAGFVTNINVEQGDHVSKGQLLATLDNQVLMQTLSELESALAFATEIYDKQKNLWDQNIGSEVQYLTAKNNKESLENKIYTLKEQIDLTRIKSPINGTIEEISVKVGQTVAPGIAAFRIVNFSKIKVVADIAEVYSPKVKTGDSVEITFPDMGKMVRAKISFASKFINPTNRTFQVECRLNPGKQEFRANMIAILRILDYKAENAVVIPVNILKKSPGETYVFVAYEENGIKKARKQNVTVGYSYNGKLEITEGLNFGDKLISFGYQDLNDGQLIHY